MSFSTNPVYCKLNDGRDMVVFSENTAEETMYVYPVSDLALEPALRGALFRGTAHRPQ